MKYPIGIQNFSEIVDGGYVYLDKTKLLCPKQEYWSEL